MFFRKTSSGLAKTLQPEPKTVALVGADAEFSNNVLTGARENATKFGLQIVYDRTYPPATVDFSPIVRAVRATNPDVVLVASYPPDSVRMVRSAAELGLKTQLFGGAMVGLQYAPLIGQLSDKLNRVVNYHLWIPSPTMNFPGIEAFLKRYQGRAKEAGVDPLGFYQPPFAYAAMQILEQAVTATKSLDDGKLADYIHATTFQQSLETLSSTLTANGLHRGCCCSSFRTYRAPGSSNSSRAAKR